MRPTAWDLAAGDLVDGRFALARDGRAALEDRGWARKPWLASRPDRPLDPWLRGTERTTGAPVLIEPRDGGPFWVEDLAREAEARRVAAARAPWVVTVLHVGSGVVYAAPPEGIRREPLPLDEAASLALQACEAAAALHAAGVIEVRFDPHHLRIVEHAGRREIQWLVPGLPRLSFPWPKEPEPEDSPITAARRSAPRPLSSPLQRHLWCIVDFFVSLSGERVLRPEGNAALASLGAMFTSPSEHLPPDAATLARAFLPLVPSSPDLAARIDALPKVAAVPRRWLDWNVVIAEGEAELASQPPTVSPSRRRSITFPLAAAYHQRAGRAWAEGDRAAALRDAERAVALDGDWLPYQTTRALALDAAGRHAEARQALDEAIARAPQPSEEDRPFFLRYNAPPSAAEHARAHAVRGTIALHLGERADAVAHLRRAVEMVPGTDAQIGALYARLLEAANRPSREPER